MIVNIPSSLRTAPFNFSRPNYIEGFKDGSGFVFNAQNPFGVKYLPAETFKIYLDLISTKGNPPMVDLSVDPIFSTFIKHGLANTENGNQVQRKEKPKALTVWFHISNACNLACNYCYIPKLVKAADLATMGSHFMSASTSENATNNLFQFCIDNNFTYLQIKFAGGEPTLNAKLIEETCITAMQLSEKHKIKVAFRILTNGVFIDDDIFRIFKKFNFGVSISLDGDEERHNDIRFTIPRSRSSDTFENSKREGTWEIINKNIERLLSEGIKPYILCTITQKNYKYLLGLVKYCVLKRIGFRLSPVRDKISHLKENLENDILNELINVYEWIGNNLPFSMPIERFARFAEWNLVVRKQSVCGTCKSTMSIDQEGRVASCQMRMDKPFGNVNNEDLTGIFSKIKSAEENRYLTSPESKSEDCSVCYWKYTCAGGCPEHTRIAIGTVNSPSPWCHLYQDFLPHYLKAIAIQIKRTMDYPTDVNQVQR